MKTLRNMFSIPIIISIVSAIGLIGSALYQQKERLQDEKDKKRLELKNDEAQAKISKQADDLINNNKELINTQKELNNKSNNLLSVYQDLDKKNDELAKSQAEVINQSKQLLTVYGELSKKNDELVASQTEGMNQSVGKGSMPIIELILSTGVREGMLQVNIYNDGNYPVTGIQVLFDDYYTRYEIPPYPSKRDEALSHWQATLGRYKKVIPIASIAKGQKLEEIYSFNLPQDNNDILPFNFTVMWKDGSYTCNGWFQNPRKYRANERPKNIPQSVLNKLNQLTYTNNLGVVFVPHPYHRF